MACTISTSQEQECVWMIKNSLYEWFIKLVTQRYQDDLEVTSQLVRSVYTNGISLDILYEKNPDLTRRIVVALKEVATEIANGRHVIMNEDAFSSPDGQKKCRDAFLQLIPILEKHFEI